MNSQQLKKFKLPDRPGVYFFEEKGKVLYIGKATSLRDRIKSYFSKNLISSRGPHLVDMLFRSRNIKWQETDSALEALILEANLIKKYKPYYNTKEKDDKSWNYVCITDEILPKIFIERGKNLVGVESKKLKVKGNLKNKSGIKFRNIYGPYTSGASLWEALKIIRRIFPFIDNSSSHKDKYEFYRQIGLTPDMADKEVAKNYKNTVRNLELFFAGKKKQIIINLKREMFGFAKKREFEKAGEVKKKIFALEHIHDISLIKEENLEEGNVREYRIESYDIAHMGGKNMVGVMTVVTNGIADKNEYRKFIIRTQDNSNDTGALEEILSRRFRHTEWGLPDLVVIDGSTAQKNVAERVLKRYQYNIPVISVVKDEHHKPKKLLGDHGLIRANRRIVLMANTEAHIFAITFHKKRRNKNFIKK